MIEIGSKMFMDKEMREMSFEIRNADVSVVNAIRRTVLTDIETLVMRGFPYNENNIEISKNTTKFNNEYLKHRLSCIPICNSDQSSFDNYVKNYVIELDETNDGVEKRYITTEHLKVKNVNTGEYFDEKMVRESFFPADSTTGEFILICILYPSYNKKEDKESLKFVSRISKGKAKDNSCWNVVHNCTHEFIQDEEKVNAIVASANMTKYDEKDFRLLDAQRIVHQNEYKMTIQTLDIYNSVQVLHIACNYIIDRLRTVIQICEQKPKILSKEATEYNATNGMLSEEELNSIAESYAVFFTYDGFIVLEIMDDDYTIGKLLEKHLYHQYGSGLLEYVGFKKEHPTTPEAFIYMKFSDKRNEVQVHDMISATCTSIINSFNKIKENIKE